MARSRLDLGYRGDMAIVRLRTTVLLLAGLTLIGFGVVEASARSTRTRGTSASSTASAGPTAAASNHAADDRRRL